MPNSLQSLVIEKIIREPEDVKTFELKPYDGRPFEYQAGQFLTLVFDHHGQELRRSYSLLPAKSGSNCLRIAVKRLDNGAYSRLLFDKAVEGTVLHAAGIGGLFTLPKLQDEIQQYYFFAAGIGITPILALINELLLTTVTPLVTLVYSNESITNTAFYSELNALQFQYPSRFSINYLFSQSFDLSRARLSKELLPKLVKETLQYEISQIMTYTCGPVPYMRMVIYGLEELGLHAEQIKREQFQPPLRNPTVNLPPDTAPHQVTIHQGAHTYVISVRYPESLLRAALRAGIPIPYSCEGGSCGSCVAQCTAGNLWMANNEVLTPRDIRNGSVLTCQAFPIHGDAAISVGG